MITGSNRGIGRWEWSHGRSGPVIELQPDGVNVVVLEPFTYHDPDGKAWTVPAGTVSDGASIPRPLWTLIGSPLTGKYRRIALVHDYLYRSQVTTKDVADRVLLDGMRCDGCDEQLANTIYEGVHLGGMPSWNADANRLKGSNS